MKSSNAAKMNEQLEPSVAAMLPELMDKHIQDGTSTVNLEVTSALFSIAISQKRIADALWGIEGTSGLLQLLNPLDIRNNY